MAWYTVNHSCGHEQRVQLYGKTSDRESKIEWMSRQDCPACWGAKKREAEALKPIEMSIQMNGLDRDAQGHLITEVVLTGGTQPRKNEIKALGYKWTEVRGGAMNLLSAKKAEMAWVKTLRTLDLVDENSVAWQTIKSDAATLGVENVKNTMSVIDLEMARQSVQKEQEAATAAADKAAKIAAIAKPQRPACHPCVAHPEGKWNGNYYGNEKRGWEYYVNNVKYKLTNEEYAVCMAYREAFAAYKKQVEAIN